MWKKVINNNYKYDIATMNPALSTALQSWSRPKLLGIVAILAVLHVGVFFMGVVFAPEMFHDAKVPGTVCVKNQENPNTWYDGQATETTRCLPLGDEGRVESLKDSLLAFRFPSDKTQVNMLYFAV